MLAEKLGGFRRRVGFLEKRVLGLGDALSWEDIGEWWAKRREDDRG